MAGGSRASQPAGTPELTTHARRSVVDGYDPRQLDGRPNGRIRVSTRHADIFSRYC